MSFTFETFKTHFPQALLRQWKLYEDEVNKVKGQPKVVLPSPDKVLMATELVLDDQGELVEVNRVHGENEVGLV